MGSGWLNFSAPLANKTMTKISRHTTEWEKLFVHHTVFEKG